MLHLKNHSHAMYRAFACRLFRHLLQSVAELQVCSLNATIRNDLNVDNKDTSNGLLVNLTA